MNMPWGGTLSAQARDDIEALVEAGLTAARGALAHATTFAAIPLAVSIDGEALQLAHDLDGLRRRTPEAVATSAVDVLLRTAPQARAVSLVTASRIRSGRTDAIEVWVEHREGAALTVLQPLKRNAAGRPVYGELAAYNASRLVWAGGGALALS